jgi:hypothetical protein
VHKAIALTPSATSGIHMPAYNTTADRAAGFEKKDRVKPSLADKADAAKMIVKSDDALKVLLDGLGIDYREAGRVKGTMRGNHSHAHTLMHTHTCTHTHSHVHLYTLIHTVFAVYSDLTATAHPQAKDTANSINIIARAIARKRCVVVLPTVRLSFFDLFLPFCRMANAEPDAFDAMRSFMDGMPAELKLVFEISYDRPRKTMRAKMVEAPAAATSASATSDDASDDAASADDASDDAASDDAASDDAASDV